MDCKTKAQLLQQSLDNDFISYCYNVASPYSNTNHKFYSSVYSHIGNVVDSIGWSIGIYALKSNLYENFN